MLEPMTHESAAHESTASIEEIEPAECWQLLRSKTVGRLGTCYATVPDIFPVNFVVDGDEIVFRTEAGTKLAAATMMPTVAFEVDEVDEPRRLAWSVVVHGRAREVDGYDQILEAEQLPLETWAPGSKGRWVRVQVAEITGRRVIGPPLK
jgi:nitroimidazol reductase NimA-like FMN-containing flavoprotein (pyridoxamine 5'-phosphate oxidase superfamily)